MEGGGIPACLAFPYEISFFPVVTGEHMNLTSGSFRLFRLAGIDVYLHWSWLLVAWLQLTWSNSVYPSNSWKVAEYFCFLGLVFLHEMGHALACRSVGGRADRIVLWPLGGVTYVAPPPRPGPVLWSILAGPLVNFVLIFPFLALFVYGRTHDWAATAPDLYNFAGRMTLANGILLLNLLPIYPLDGGQILQALLWYGLGRWRSLQVVSLVGILFGAVLFAFALFFVIVSELFGLLLAVMAAFIAFRSLVSFQQARAILLLLELPRHEDCACPNCGMGPPRGLFWVCEHCQTRFDLFDTRGKCPACGAWYLDPDCPHCRQSNHIDRWFTSPKAPESEVAAAKEPVPQTPAP